MDEEYARETMAGAMAQMGEMGLSAKVLTRRTRLEQLQDMREALAQKLQNVDDAIEALKTNPAINNVLDKLDKVMTRF